MYKPNLIVIVEGQTEVSALERIIGQYLYTAYGLYAQFPAIGKTGTQKGGHKAFEVFASQIKKFARQYPGVYISTCFDYYGFNPGWEDFLKLKNTSGKATEKVSRMEALMASKVMETCGKDFLWKNHFLPYIQLHELEALLFADTDVLGGYLKPLDGTTDLKLKFREIRSSVKNCEEINDSRMTAPSRRIEKLADYIN